MSTELVRPEWQAFVAQMSGYVLCNCGQTLQTREQLREHWQEGHFDRPKDEDQLSAEEIDRRLNAVIDALPPDDEKQSQPTIPDGVAARGQPWDLQLFVDTKKGRSKLPRSPLPPIIPPIGSYIVAGGKRFRIRVVFLNFDARCYEVICDLGPVDPAAPSRRGIYRESGTKCVVEILSDESENSYRTVKLRCIEVIRESELCPMKVGEEWDAVANIAHQAMAGWDLSEDEPA